VEEHVFPTSQSCERKAAPKLIVLFGLQLRVGASDRKSQRKIVIIDITAFYSTPLRVEYRSDYMSY